MAAGAFCCSMLVGAMLAADVPARPIDVGSRLELFVDDHLIDEMNGAALRLHHPTPRNVAIVHNAPWEGSGCHYMTVFQDGDRYRMYYRGLGGTYAKGGFTMNHPQFTCYAESKDGIRFTKPELGLVEFNGSKANNIILTEKAVGPAAHNFTPFKDTNPNCKPDEKYKAVATVKGGLGAFTSADGIHWSRMGEEPIITQGAFDSQNLAFWDGLRGEYRAYWRHFRNGRDIMTATSKDFRTWSKPQWLRYSPGRTAELYTNGIAPYFRAPHIFLGFPTRYIDRGWQASMEALPQLEHRRIRASKSRREGTAVTDGLFMSSRDALCFHVWPESFIRPGLRFKDSWFYGDVYQNWGLVVTEAEIDGMPDELSMYVIEGTGQGDSCRHRRYTIRMDGFVSVNAPMCGGELLTKPIVFQGKHLVLNFSTSAAGRIRVEMQNDIGQPIDGFRLGECAEIFGDDLERMVVWDGGSDVGKLAGRPVRLRIELRDADLYSIRFAARPPGS